jgi:hypothetical protein
VIRRYGRPGNPWMKKVLVTLRGRPPSTVPVAMGGVRRSMIIGCPCADERIWGWCATTIQPEPQA